MQGIRPRPDSQPVRVTHCLMHAVHLAVGTCEFCQLATGSVPGNKRMCIKLLSKLHYSSNQQVWLARATKGCRQWEASRDTALYHSVLGRLVWLTSCLGSLTVSIFEACSHVCGKDRHPLLLKVRTVFTSL